MWVYSRKSEIFPFSVTQARTLVKINRQKWACVVTCKMTLWLVGMNRLCFRVFFSHTLRIQHVCDGQTQPKGAVFQNPDDVFDVQMSSSSLQMIQHNTKCGQNPAREPGPTCCTRSKPAVPENRGTQMYNIIKAFTKCTNVNHKACKKPAFRWWCKAKKCSYMYVYILKSTDRYYIQTPVHADFTLLFAR